MGYFPNGTGRDSYITSTNGGFYPGIPVAAYQRTYVNQLRSYDKASDYRPRSSYRQRVRSTSFKNYRIATDAVPAFKNTEAKQVAGEPGPAARAEDRPKTAAAPEKQQVNAFKTIDAGTVQRLRPVVGLKTDIRPTIIPQS